jgi:hypothetical protein
MSGCQYRAPRLFRQLGQPVQRTPGRTRPGSQDRIRRTGLRRVLRLADHRPGHVQPLGQRSLRPEASLCPGPLQQVGKLLSRRHVRTSGYGVRPCSVTGLLLPIITPGLPPWVARS